MMKRSQKTRALEAQVRRMEEILRTAGIDPGESVFDPDAIDDDDELESENGDYDRSNHLSSDYSSASPEDKKSFESGTSPQSTSSISVETPSQALVLKTDRGRDGIFFGSSSSLHILSQEGIRFIREKSGIEDFPNGLLAQPCWSAINFSPLPIDIYTDLFECRVYKALPPRSEVFSLLRNYFGTINRIFPIIHEATFMEMVEWQYTQQKCTDVGRWASINALLALSFRYKGDRGPRPEKDTERAWLYWKNAAAVYTELSLRPNDVLGIQALLAMAIFARVNGHPQLAIPLITAAMKSAQALGLHRRNLNPDISACELETRRRVWWCIFIMDQGIGIKTGRGYLQHPDDSDVALPGEDAKAFGDFQNGCRWSIKLFRSICSHSVLVSNIYRELYTTKAFYKSFPEVCETVTNLSDQLREWKREYSCLSYTPPKSKESNDLNREEEVKIIAHISEKLTYLNSLILINRMPLLFEVAAQKGAHPDRDAKTRIKNISATSRHHHLICLHAARDSLQLLERLPWRDVGFSWAILDFLFYAASILFTHIVDQPLVSETGSVEENLAMLNLATNYFFTLASLHGRSKSVKFMASMSSIMERTAKKIIDRALKEINVAAGNKKEEATTAPAPKQQPPPPSTTVEQPNDIQIPDTNLPSSMSFSVPFPDDTFSTGLEDMFSQNSGYPYMDPMSEQNIQMTGPYTQVYNNLYQYDIPSYMMAPVPDAFWGQETTPDMLGNIPMQGKYGQNMDNDAMLEYMWSNNR
ncbi:conserved hypothetical protein [Talaromyces stipitatus ATCC 10500]|uniref:Xylanolytic transcriptional activator regulatory domain-containing protein n=1 Tax=Talaromyces stipitatus (strain ATCC 10500 / CBS 375.48 / QM 6759 / NRRL 1006) TaxID=441959 RepID=B8MGZ5_TALSN|nr:uncharacterized protein TSTA_014680 [Talaromyces stipitatus ATCC 10500]EED16376.1 conserved hypothetical protein [Talaromyces stipitatus ATCC 10500]